MGCSFCTPTEITFDTKYELGESIGSGHFAQVHTCFDRKARKKYAVKVINKTHLVNFDILKSEVDILKEVGDHPNILTLIDTFDTETEFLIITEFCSGGDLFTRIVETGHWSEMGAVHIMKQLVEAIQHIHHHGVTHRDLKPENILLLSEKKDSVIKVADFGLSKLKDDKESVMKTVCGTWAYCAPEVVRRQPYTHLVDNWTLGILMFVMLSGYHPFDMYGDATENELLKSIDAIKYDFDDEVWEHVSDSAKEIITNLMKADPLERLTCEQLLETDWINGKIGVSRKTNPKVLENLMRLNEARKKLQITVATAVAATKFKRKLKFNSKNPKGDIKKAWVSEKTKVDLEKAKDIIPAS